MEIIVHREKNTNLACTGKLDIDGKFECYTLEPPVRHLGPNGEGKIWGKTAIPTGRYLVLILFSPHFGRMMPRLMNVPFFDGILIHGGNDAKDTEGCIIVGTKELNSDYVQGGLIEAPEIEKKIQAAKEESEDVWITMQNEFVENIL